jgi:hypothetical protein
MRGDDAGGLARYDRLAMGELSIQERYFARQVVPNGGFCFHAKAGAGRF